MHPEHSFKTAICSDYETLLFTCHRALDGWRARREEVAALGFVSKKSADELVKLQADYARAYSKLESHEDHCDVCQFVSKIGGRTFAGISAGTFEKKHYA